MRDVFEKSDEMLWVSAVLLYGVGDTATTFWGLSVDGIGEAGPVAAFFFDTYGLYSFLGVKLAVFAVFYAVWLAVHTPARTAVPLALVVVGGVVTSWNLYTITSAL
jgi:hypothetical protein